MHPEAMIPYGLALLAYFDGETSAELTIRRDDGIVDRLPVSGFFRSYDEFTPIEIAALQLCRGHILDIGAGTGLHSLVLQSQGRTVTSIDINQHAVDILIRRGVEDARCDDIFTLHEGPFDTLLLLGRGIGMVENLSGLSRFLDHSHQLTSVSGQILLHSLDVRSTDEPVHLAYHEASREAGKYIGEVRIQFEYDGHLGPYCGWLHVDPETLCSTADQRGWECKIVKQEEGGDYLARLTHK